MAASAQNEVINGNLHLSSTNGEGLRIGKINDIGNKNVPNNGLAAQYNIDFSGYRDISPNQIGARIAALRFNRFQENNALIQKTALAFYTNQSGINTGTTDLVEQMRITPEGNIGMGTTIPQSKLDVRGKIIAQQIEVKILSGADFVFSTDYILRPLSELETFIKENKHLPEIPSEKKMIEDGLNINQMQIKLLQKVEELTLYVIEQNKRIERLEAENEKLKKDKFESN